MATKRSIDGQIKRVIPSNPPTPDICTIPAWLSKYSVFLETIAESQEGHEILSFPNTLDKPFHSIWFDTNPPYLNLEMIIIEWECFEIWMDFLHISIQDLLNDHMTTKKYNIPTKLIPPACRQIIKGLKRYYLRIESRCHFQMILDSFETNDIKWIQYFANDPKASSDLKHYCYILLKDVPNITTNHTPLTRHTLLCACLSKSMEIIRLIYPHQYHSEQRSYQLWQDLLKYKAYDTIEWFLLMDKRALPFGPDTYPVLHHAIIQKDKALFDRFIHFAQTNNIPIHWPGYLREAFETSCQSIMEECLQHLTEPIDLRWEFSHIVGAHYDENFLQWLFTLPPHPMLTLHTDHLSTRHKTWATAAKYIQTPQIFDLLNTIHPIRSDCLQRYHINATKHFNFCAIKWLENRFDIVSTFVSASVST